MLHGVHNDRLCRSFDGFGVRHDSLAEKDLLVQAFNLGFKTLDFSQGVSVSVTIELSMQKFNISLNAGEFF